MASKLLALLASIFISVVMAQTATLDITGNLVNNTQTATSVSSTWQGGTFVNSLDCWAPGGPGYCGPNAMIRPAGDINFSYGLTNLYQYVNVAKALPYSGTNLVTTGFKFQWTSKNGNGWDDGRLDQLSAYVNLYDKGGSNILESYNYNLNFIHNWTTFDWKQDWSKLRRPNDVSNVQFGFVGKDNNFWAGPYGPEIRDVSFQLKYKPDPCVNNPLYSPDCPKFQEALQKTTSSTIDTTKPTVEYTPEVQQNNTIKPRQEDKALLEERPYEQETNFVDLNRLVDTLIKINDNQTKEEKLSLDTANTALTETEKFSQQVIRQAEQLANKASRQSLDFANSSQQFNTEQSNNINKNQQILSLFQVPNANTTTVFQLPGLQQFNVLKNPSNNTNQVLQTNQQDYKTKSDSVNNTTISNQQNLTTASSTYINTFQQTNIVNSVSNNLLTLFNNPLLGQTLEIPSNQSNFLLNKSDPINLTLQSNTNQQNDKTETSSSAIKQQDNKDNDIAGTVVLAQIAVVPVGYNQYLNLVLKDSVFYQPKEIYRNQRTTDNNRALQNLRSDQLHQQMIDQQWR